MDERTVAIDVIKGFGAHIDTNEEMTIVTNDREILGKLINDENGDPMNITRPDYEMANDDEEQKKLVEASKHDDVENLTIHIFERVEKEVAQLVKQVSGKYHGSLALIENLQKTND